MKIRTSERNSDNLATINVIEMPQFNVFLISRILATFRRHSLSLLLQSCCSWWLMLVSSRCHDLPISNSWAERKKKKIRLTFLLHQSMLVPYQPFLPPLILSPFSNLDDSYAVIQFWQPYCVFLPTMRLSWHQERHFLFYLNRGRGSLITWMMNCLNFPGWIYFTNTLNLDRKKGL